MGWLFGKTLEDRMIETQGRPSGFDYMRIILALAVILCHSFLITEGNVDHGPGYNRFEMIFRMIVPMFFALSGFLVAGSLERARSLVSFLGLRVFRIMPALSVEVLISALIIGPIFTTLTLSEYFSHPEFHVYFFNIIGEIHYYLPGVFKDHPFDQVNGQLWTVPYELVCYVLISIFAVFAIFHHKRWLLVATILFYGLQVVNTIYRPHTDLAAPAGSTVVLCFVAGLLVYQYRHSLPWTKGAFLLSVIISVAMLLTIGGIRFAAMPLAYMTIYLGLLNPARNKIVLSGDYSYGVYLYGFPIQQAIFASAEIFHIWYWNFIGASVISIILACMSWWLVEKPVLAKRDVLKRLENRYLAIPAVQSLRGKLASWFGRGDINAEPGLLKERKVDATP